MNNRSITTIARRYVGIKGFTVGQSEESKFFMHDLKAVRWERGDPLDLAFARMCYHRYYKDKPGLLALEGKQTVFACLNVKHSPYWLTHRDRPESGDLMFCRCTKTTRPDMYHVAIVDSPVNSTKHITTFETPLFITNWGGEMRIVKNTLRNPHSMFDLELVFFARLIKPTVVTSIRGK